MCPGKVLRIHGHSCVRAPLRGMSANKPHPHRALLERRISDCACLHRVPAGRCCRRRSCGCSEAVLPVVGQADRQNTIGLELEVLYVCNYACHLAHEGEVVPTGRPRSCTHPTAPLMSAAKKSLQPLL